MLDRLKELLGTMGREVWLIAGIAVAAIGIMFLMLHQAPQQTTAQPESAVISDSLAVASSSAPSAAASQSMTMYVDIKGAVKNPGLKKVTGDMRVIDAVQLAGGFAASADQKQVNLAQRLTDQQVVYIPKRGETAPSMATGGAGAGASSEAPQVNLNSADLEQLQQLDGVGEKKAQKIIDYRTAKGQFQSIEDIKNVSGFGDKTFERLKPQLAV